MIFKFIYFAIAIAHVACTSALGKAVAGGQLFHSFDLEADFYYYFTLVMLTLGNFVLIYEVYKIILKRNDSRLVIVYVDILPMIAGFFVGMHVFR